MVEMTPSEKTGLWHYQSSVNELRISFYLPPVSICNPNWQWFKSIRPIFKERFQVCLSSKSTKLEGLSKLQHYLQQKKAIPIVTLTSVWLSIYWMLSIFNCTHACPIYPKGWRFKGIVKKLDFVTRSDKDWVQDLMSQGCVVRGLFKNMKTKVHW